ncbi:MAG TPA: post-transcriptional regulator [Candidatus Merdibacter merdavium]|uniref:Post-transcriptional regulator n=1 Tax=Candidatus Merdibacter merdavium TaxID=2838692 RepID=A0A9D2SWV3_9FIRM|nr:post-transcriptional regulator [Candidatus Merdibacter merdavium]
MRLDDLLENRFIQLTIYLQLRRLQREQLSSLTYQHLEDTLKGLIWKKQVPLTLHEAVDDILKLKVGEIVAYLTRQVIVQGKTADLDEVYRKIGGLNE